jgi:diguanylate cyclase (GGDEF)-like protein/PAS domain S-box-containing protein
MSERSVTREGLLEKLDAIRQLVIELERDEKTATTVEEALLRFQKAVETMQIGVTITDVNGTIIYTNPADARMHGYTVDELIGQNAGIFSPSQLPRQEIPPEELALMSSWRRETTNARKDGTVFPVHLMSDVVKSLKGEILGIVSTCEDISERKAAEAALRESEERYSLAAAGANDGLWDWDLNTNRVYFSPRWKEILGYSEGGIGDNPEEWLKRVHPEDRDSVQTEIDNHLSAASSHLEIEHRVEHRDGTYRWILCRGLAVRDDNATPYRIAGSFSDITARKRVEEQLLRDAVRDQLTGLPNRGVILRAISRSLGRAARKDGYRFAILHLNVDRLRLINESLGRHAGDRLLGEIADRLQVCVRPSDLLVRLGGDEFGLLVEDIDDPTDATRVAARISEEMSSPFSVVNREVFATASVGIVVSGPKYKHAEELLRDANTAMNRAKASGGRHPEVYDEATQRRSYETLQIETGLRWALERDELIVQYQPIVSLDSGKIAGLESLVRWDHPELGIVPPDDFIPLAEETGLIVPLGWQVLSKSCKQMKEWRNTLPPSGPIDLSVNLSSKQFMQPDVVDQIRRALHEAGLDPKCLRLEMTESALMENAEVVFPLLTELQSLNVRLYVDDFGTGYSSLSYLHKLPIDTLKIDRSFVMDLGTREEALEIVKTIVTLAHNLKMQVVAEGVETQEQASILRGLGCEYAQGFYFSEPVDGATIADLLLNDTTFL